MNPVLTLTRDDFRVEYIKGLGGGNGGQGMQKRATGVRITHIDSGASASCSKNREQSRNVEEAFRKLSIHPKFMAWINARCVELARGTIDEAVDRMMAAENIKTEVQEDGRWKPAPDDWATS